jgi:hypothetical protein
VRTVLRSFFDKNGFAVWDGKRAEFLLLQLT